MAQDTPSRHLDQFMLRLPDGMRDRIATEAKTNKRSMNAEIVARLEASLQSPGERFADVAEFANDMDKIATRLAEMVGLARQGGQHVSVEISIGKKPGMTSSSDAPPDGAPRTQEENSASPIGPVNRLLQL